MNSPRFARRFFRSSPLSLISSFARCRRHFAKAAERNPLLYVEGLFGVGSRWRKFCEMASNVYLDEGALTGEKRGGRGEEDDEDDEDTRGGQRR